MRKRTKSTNNQTVPGFLSKTYKILENEEYNDIISWNIDGRSFLIKSPNEFAEKILPKHFKTNNFSSFVRQLNMYDFHKQRHDNTDMHEWSHRLFRKGYANLLSQIKRKIYEVLKSQGHDNENPNNKSKETQNAEGYSQLKGDRIKCSKI
ncbi:hypothetical protein IMG5_164750 [Ichthyophthirius multifiliis]|uniref:HSF-type DNA-binding domain-containing protein n=1 Tax=Ichthyophthirius multifiliis TaxID=5932 RepID=G0R0J1_ICHMU|nr:hypothetical protein IMG5_164750 [Ichthyophthirius multifiliis]EGR29016.1 hypothetical protein IMG5_164750 [Ichthyophthirius multifiliis]|eukprot:XP_004030252.1 hypothetical protein IMG5_164750 [Ichthyophthirius multifiliis]